MSERIPLPIPFGWFRVADSNGAPVDANRHETTSIGVIRSYHAQFYA